MPRITFTYEEAADGDIIGRIDEIRGIPDTFWSSRSRSAVARELVRRALNEIEAELEPSLKRRSQLS
jgi:hypothetical protein